MAKLNDLEDVTISNPKVGDVVKYSATGWVNGADATGTPTGVTPVGTLMASLKMTAKKPLPKPGLGK